MSKNKNSFSFFLDEYLANERRMGRNLSKRVAAEECAPLWESLGPEEKQHYVDLAKNYKCQRDAKKASTQWLDPLFPHEGVGDKTNEITYLMDKIKHESDLRTHDFYIIHVNYYCKTEHGVYVPGELALSQFNLESGIKKTYHTLIDPGKIPLGYAFESKRFIEEIHGLPFPPYEGGNRDYKDIFTKVCEFLKAKTGKNVDNPPIFTLQNQVVPVLNILQRLCDDDAFEFKVYPMHKMFFWLKNKCTEVCKKGIGFPVLSNAVSELEKDVFRYCTDLSCDFHTESVEKYQNCSLSIVRRLAYILCDHCCRHLNITLIRGNHLPLNYKLCQDSQAKNETSNSVGSKRATSEMDFMSSMSEICGLSNYAASTVGDSASETGEFACGVGKMAGDESDSEGDDIFIHGIFRARERGQTTDDDTSKTTRCSGEK